MSETEANSLFEHLAAEIENSNAPLSSTLRSVYEHKGQSVVSNILDERIVDLENKVKNICSQHHTSFIDSVKNLDELKIKSRKLVDKLLQFNGNYDQSTRSLISQTLLLENCTETQLNIADVTERLYCCLPVLEKYSKLQEQLQDKMYYPALKTLEQLENTYLPAVVDYSFAAVMSQVIRNTLNEIKIFSKNDRADYLESVKKNSAMIGEIAMVNAIKQLQWEKSENMVIRSPEKEKIYEKPVWKIVADEPEDITKLLETSLNSNQSKVDEIQTDILDYGPLYRCYHINSLLATKEGFRTEYLQIREKQILYIVEDTKRINDTSANYRNFLYGIVGSFVIEHHVLRNTDGLITQKDFHGLWNLISDKCCMCLRRSLSQLDDPETMRQVKNMIVLFCFTLRGYNLDVSGINNLVDEFWRQYCVTLSKNRRNDFNKIFDNDDYAPIRVTSLEEFNFISSQFPNHGLPKPNFNRCAFFEFPYSKFVLKVYKTILEFIRDCVKFTVCLNFSRTKVDNMLKTSTYSLLENTLSTCLRELLKKNTLTLTQLVQITRNLKYLDRSIQPIKEYIASISDMPTDDASWPVFKNANSASVTQINTKMGENIDQFFSLASYDKVIDDTAGTRSDYISDLLDFLRCYFPEKTEDEHTQSILPEEISPAVCMAVCQRLAKNMQNTIILGPTLQYITSAALNRIYIDVFQCETFAKNCYIKGVDNSAVFVLAFEPVHQLVELAIYGDWDAYIREYGQQESKYIRVDLRSAITVIDKLKKGDNSGSLLSSFSKTKREHKKQFEIWDKLLRGLLTNDGR